MRLGRRTELLIGASAFAALGLAFVWHGSVSGGATAVFYGTLGGATLLAVLLFVRARWTPPLPGPPVSSAGDGE